MRRYWIFLNWVCPQTAAERCGSVARERMGGVNISGQCFLV